MLVKLEKAALKIKLNSQMDDNMSAIQHPIVFCLDFGLLNLSWAYKLFVKMLVIMANADGHIWRV